MRVVHCCLSNFYIDDYTYQENMLIHKHVEMGCDVLVLASTETYNSELRLDYLNPSEYIGSEGARVIRVPYSSILPFFLMKKIRAYSGVIDILENFKPDVIMFHGPCAWELLVVTKYVKRHGIKLYVDSHEDKNNSARSWISYILLYKFFYVPIIRKCRKYVNKFLYISYESKLFCNNIYGLSDAELEFYPLGGIVFDDLEYKNRRSKSRCELDINADDIVFFQSGKFDKKKKLLQSLEAFKKTSASNVRLVIAGGFDEEIACKALELIHSDKRIRYLGWVDPEQLQDLLCCADVYVQPGSQSATLQMSICARCAVIIDDVISHRFIIKDNGFFVKNNKDLQQAYQDLIESPTKIAEMSRFSLEYAKENLDYQKLADRLLR